MLKVTITLDGLFGESAISVRSRKRDFQGLVRKISEGFSFEEAAETSGIPIKEASEFIKKQAIDKEVTGWNIARFAQEHLKISFKTLNSIAEKGPRYGDKETRVVSSDLEAAKTLAQLSVDLLKISRGYAQDIAKIEAGNKATGSGEQKDLFDLSGPWKLRRPDQVI